MSLFLIGPWLHALWNRAQEAGHSEAVNVHPERHRRVREHVAHGSGSRERDRRCQGPNALQEWVAVLAGDDAQDE